MLSRMRHALRLGMRHWHLPGTAADQPQANRGRQISISNQSHHNLALALSRPSTPHEPRVEPCSDRKGRFLQRASALQGLPCSSRWSVCLDERTIRSCVWIRRTTWPALKRFIGLRYTLDERMYFVHSRAALGQPRRSLINALACCIAAW